MKPASTKRAEPLRLLRRSGSWSVEYTRLISVDEHILRPERRRAPATTELLRSLGENYPRDRLDEAVALMDAADDGSERAFELGDDGWLEAATATPSQRPLGRNELQTMLTETKSQLAVLRGLYDALLSRVVALEGQSAQSLRSLPPRTVRRVPSRKSVLDALRLGSSRDAAKAPRDDAPPPASHAPAFEPPRVAAAPAAPPPEPPRAAEPSPDATQASPGAPALSMPASADIVSCLQMLVADLTINAAKTPAPTEHGDFYVAALSDEAGEPLAALLFNHRAAAELGAGILMASIEDRNQQAQGELTSDTLDGLNEVANNLTGLLNRTNPNRLVRLGALERAPAAPPVWLKNPAKTRAFSLRENGSLFLLVR